MNYFIKRELNEYGPYSLADLQKYVASGNVLLTDLCRSEGLTDWVPVSEVLGNIPVPVAAPVPQPVAGTVYGGQPAYGGPAGYAAPTSPQFPPPPSLHWGVLVLLGVLTCGLFGWVWAFIQAAWVKKVQPESKALIYYGISVGLLVLMFGSAFAAGAARKSGAANNSLFFLFLVGGRIIWLVSAFYMRTSVAKHFI